MRRRRRPVQKSSLVEQQRDSLLNDVRKLNLTKYIAEAINAMAAISEVNKVDIGTAVDV